MEVLYTKEHEWIRIDGSKGLIGITEYAAQQLGDITFVELPPPGKEIKQSQVMLGIESVKAASDVFAPLSGRVVSVNQELDEHPEIINESPEDKGWLVEIEIDDTAGKGNLLTRSQYDEYLQGML